jgi:hypothetical protein
MSTYVVKRTGDGRVINWHGKPIHYRINWTNLNSDRRTRVNNALADMCPRIGSGCTNDGQTSQTPNSGREVYELAGTSNVYVWAKAFDEPTSAVGWADMHWVGDQYLGGVVVFNTTEYSRWTLSDFKNFCWHEIGHIGGLGHPTSTVQVMNTSANVPPPYRSGDLAGFAVLKAAR